MFKELVKFMRYDKLIAEDDPLPEPLEQNVEVADNVENEVGHRATCYLSHHGFIMLQLFSPNITYVLFDT